MWVFKGIPYAAPPVGDLRWKAPQPVTPWTDERACIAFGPACPQPSQTETFYLTVGETERGLPLSERVVAGGGGGAEKDGPPALPVMLWIHGGSFETGAGSMAVYDGAKLAQKGVVVVTINYRLGPLGFLAHPALAAESPTGSWATTAFSTRSRRSSGCRRTSPPSAATPGTSPSSASRPGPSAFSTCS